MLLLITPGVEGVQQALQRLDVSFQSTGNRPPPVQGPRDVKRPGPKPLSIIERKYNTRLGPIKRV